jgi:hypothetical protein
MRSTSSFFFSLSPPLFSCLVSVLSLSHLLFRFLYTSRFTPPLFVSPFTSAPVSHQSFSHLRSILIPTRALPCAVILPLYTIITLPFFSIHP